MNVCSPDAPQCCVYSLSLAPVWHRKRPSGNSAFRERSATQDADVETGEVYSGRVGVEKRRIVVVTDPSGVLPNRHEDWPSTRLLRWSGASDGIGSHRIGLEKARVSQNGEPSHRIGFARLRHKKTPVRDACSPSFGARSTAC